MSEREDLNIPVIATVGAVSVILTVASIFFVQSLYNGFFNAEFRRKITEAPVTQARSKLAEQDAKLSRYSWLDREQGITSIPIERAMLLVVDDLVEQSGSVDVGAQASGRSP